MILTAVTILILYVNHLFAKLNVENLDDILQLDVDQKQKITVQTRLNNGHFITRGLNVTSKQLTLHGQQLTEIELTITTNSGILFFGNAAIFKLNNIRIFTDDYLVAKIEIDSQMTFKDITLVGTSKIGNCYEVSGGKLALTNLKFNFKNNDRKISNFVSFNDIGGYLHVMNTQIKDISVGGIQPLFGDDRATEIKLTKCIFNNISNYDEYFNFNIVGQSDISVMDCSFIDVENALIGGIVNGLNQNGKLFVIGSSFYKCINARKEIRLNKDRESVISGDAIFQGSQWDECSSYNYGGALSFTSSGELTIRDCHFQQCLSVGGKGGSVYIVGQGLHQIRDCTFIGSISSYASIAEGGSLYIEGGINQLRSLIIESSKTEVSPSSDSSTSISRGGAIYATDWKNDSQIREIVIKDCESEQGAAINIESASSRIEIRDSTFQNNIALSQGGGAIFSQLDTLIQVKFTSFDHNIAYGNNKGSDLQFGGLGVSQDNVNWEQIRKDVITGCQSTSNEPRVCFNDLLCQYLWLESGRMPWWVILIIVLSVLATLAIVVGIIIFFILKYRKKINNNVQNENQNIERNYQLEQGQQNVQYIVNDEEENILQIQEYDIQNNIEFQQLNQSYVPIEDDAQPHYSPILAPIHQDNYQEPDKDLIQ